MERLCAIRDICHSISEYESVFYKAYSMCLNEGMILCTLKEGRLSSGEIASKLNLTCSNTSKLLRAVEKKGFIERDLGEKDKRQMYFTLTKKGEKCLGTIEKDNIPIPEPLSLLIHSK
ncbi:MAG: winged helix DNA-binding protein [Bacteroidales bacterium]